MVWECSLPCDDGETPTSLYCGGIRLDNYYVCPRQEAILTMFRTCRQSLSLCDVAVVFYIAFFAAVGYKALRLAFGIVPVGDVFTRLFAVVAKRSMSFRNSEILGMGYVGIVALGEVVTVVKDGP